MRQAMRTRLPPGAMPCGILRESIQSIRYGKLTDDNCDAIRLGGGAMSHNAIALTLLRFFGFKEL
jgi:hypothetical protein